LDKFRETPWIISYIINRIPLLLQIGSVKVFSNKISIVVKTKFKVLKEHCESVGRDYNSILKTKLGVIIIDDDKEMAKSRVQHAFKGIPEEQINEFVIYGTPEDVSRQIELIEQVGIQYLIVDLEPSRELEALDIFANKVIKKVS
jgi:alkanesulfonate monooxygenase SsuD/methylene tetrahydromethanopterin reductase-like flavin-dependent oxidoreductase (luciferase family)